jgi:carbamoyl-phosphate synthase small subunit
MKAMVIFNPAGNNTIKNLVSRIKKRPHPDTDNLVAKVSCQNIVHHNRGKRTRIVLIDCGVKTSILHYLKKNAHIIQVPYNTSPEAIRKLKPRGIVISNGPGDPAHPALRRTVVRSLQTLLGSHPMFGICLGHQLLGLALGMKTYKLKFGHRGSNHAVVHADTGKVYITSQNHGYALDATPSKGITINWLNANDHTVEGFTHEKLPILSVQFHPEAAPGPHDTRFLFTTFMEKF